METSDKGHTKSTTTSAAGDSKESNDSTLTTKERRSSHSSEMSNASSSSRSFGAAYKSLYSSPCCSSLVRTIAKGIARIFLKGLKCVRYYEAGRGSIYNSGESTQDASLSGYPGIDGIFLGLNWSLCAKLAHELGDFADVIWYYESASAVSNLLKINCVPKTQKASSDANEVLGSRECNRSESSLVSQ